MGEFLLVRVMARITMTRIFFSNRRVGRGGRLGDSDVDTGFGKNMKLSATSFTSNSQ